MKYLNIYSLLAVGIFSIGIIFYYLFREPTVVSSYLGIQDIHIVSEYTKYFNSFPSFAHVFSFSIFTWLVMERSYANSSILFWSILNIVAETGQIINTSSISWLPNFIEQYCIQGTYSHWDMLAILIGAMYAKLVMNFKNINNPNSTNKCNLFFFSPVKLRSKTKKQPSKNPHTISLKVQN